MTDEHRKLAAQITDLFNLPAMVGNRKPLLDLLADFERKVRLDEAKWWRYLAIMDDESYFAVEGDKRLAALESK